MARRGKARRPSVASGGSNPYDELIRVISDLVDDKMATMMPRLGTVKGKDGRRVKVQPFGEEGASEESHARDGGKNARNDDTVVLLPVGGGNFVALGPIVGHKEAGRDRDDMISGKEIEAGAIKAHHFANDRDDDPQEPQIKGRHLKPNTIGARELGRGFIERNMLHGNLASSLADAQHIGRLDRRIDSQKSRVDNLMRRMHQQDGKGEN